MPNKQKCPLKGRMGQCSSKEKCMHVKRSPAQNFADTLKDNPKKIIAWAKKEIAAYEELIKTLEK